MRPAIRFRGLTLFGTPLVFDRPPVEDSGYLVFMTEAQFQKAQDLGVTLHTLKPWDEGDHAYQVIMP